jgi:AraC family transcriptional regulator
MMPPGALARSDIGNLMQCSTNAEKSSPVPNQPDLIPSLARLLENVRKELDADREVAKALLVRAASLLRTEIDRQASECEPERKTGGLASWQVRRLNVFIEARLDQPIRLVELGAISKLSTAYFSRAFKQTFGETPHFHIMQRRLSRAEMLMLTTDLLLGDIAARCGFADQAHLCRHFRRQYKKSPAAWRRERTERRTYEAHRDFRMNEIGES